MIILPILMGKTWALVKDVGTPRTIFGPCGAGRLVLSPPLQLGDRLKRMN